MTQSQRVVFKNSSNQELAGVIEMPIGQKPKFWAIFAHCFTCSKDLKAARSISKAMALRGIAVLRFDFTGLGRSGGDFSETSFATNLDDLLDAAKYLKENYDSPQLLVGHSLGGAAVIQISPELESVKAIATIGAPSEPSYVKKLIQGDLSNLSYKEKIQVQIEGRDFWITNQFFETLDQQNVLKTLGKLNKRSLLIFHSPHDEIVGIDNAEEIFKAARHPKSYISLDKGDHLLTNENDSRYVGDMIASWSERYIISSSDESALKSEKPVLVRMGEEKYYNQIKAGNHYLVADEPKSVGGKDLGPTPYDFLNTALGTCTAMTLRMYADRKDWPLKEILVHLEHSKIHAKDCFDCESKSGKVDQIERYIELEGPLSKEQRSRLLEIADKCPVHKTLHNEVRVVTKLLE